MTSDSLRTYPAHLDRVRSLFGEEAAPQLAVGGSFQAVGRLQYLFLREMGVEPASTVIDVGCGSGRLAVHLAQLPELKYLGTDVVPGLLDHAKKLARRSDWRFELTDGAEIPAADESADVICFFSVLTHTKHEESYRYLQEARRVVKPNGKIIFSFLEFERPSHFAVFETQLRDALPEDPLTQFMDRHAIRAWCEHLDLRLERIFDGGVPHIKLEEEIVWDGGRRQSGWGDIGQSIAVLSKQSEL